MMFRPHGRSSTAAVVIYSAAALHIAEALIIAGSTAADSSVGIASLFAASHYHRLALAAVMLTASLLAITGAAAGRPSVFAMAALVPQQTFLLITAAGAAIFALEGHYADGYEPAGGQLFILADQLPRMLFVVAHGVAFYHWCWFNDGPRRKQSAVDNIVAEVTFVSQAGDPSETDLLVIAVDELRDIVESNLPAG